MSSIIIADDHKMFRDGIIAILEQESDIDFKGDAGDAKGIFDLLESQSPDILLLDIALGNTNGIELLKTLSIKYPDLKVIILSMYSESNYVMKALEVGAAGYVIKDAGKAEMLSAIRAVAAGGTFFGKQVSHILMNHLSRRSVEAPSKKEEVMLTKREVEVLKFIAAEYSNQEIAAKLFISVRTVDTHRRNLLEKLKLKNTASLVRYAIKNGLVES